MPTRKEIANEKAESIEKKKSAIDTKIVSIQKSIYNNIEEDFELILDKYFEKGTIAQTDINIIQAILKKSINANFPSVMKDTVKASHSIVDLNNKYFSTLLDTSRIEEIKAKTQNILDKKLGVNSDGTLVKNGFVDKSIAGSNKIQNQFVELVKEIITSSSDVTSAHNKLQKAIVGTELENGLIKRYYNTFAKDLLNTVDGSNSEVYATQLGLNNAYYEGGLITTSRSFCLDKNGKIFSRSQMQGWKSSNFITKMYGSKIDDYDPFTTPPGGYGCLHTRGWITDELANANKKTQNKKAADRNKKFKDGL